jgi:hypothetical protein
MTPFAEVAEEMWRAEDPAELERLLARIREGAEADSEALRRYMTTLPISTGRGSLAFGDCVEALASCTPRFADLIVALWEWAKSRAIAEPNEKNVLFAVSTFEFVAHQHADSAPAHAIRNSLVEMLGCRYRGIRRMAADMLPSFSGPDCGAAVDALVHALQDRDWRVRSLARLALREWSLLPADFTLSMPDRIREWMKRRV